MNPNALKVGVVSEDPNLIRDVSWGLSNFGYEVISAKNFEPFHESWERSPVDLLLADADHPGLAEIRQLSTLGKHGFTYKILLYDEDRPTAHLSGLESLFNDAIAKPVNGGEMLSRIRAAARFVEFERRHREQSLLDRPTGLMSQRGLLKILDKVQESADDGEPQSFAMVILSLDYLDAFTESQGVKTRDQLLREVAQLLVKTAGEEEYTARLQNDALALVIPDSSLEEGEAVATLLRGNLENTVLDVGGMQLRRTATLYVVAWDPTASPFRSVLETAERTLDHARLLGGGAIVHCGQFDQDFSAWQDKNWAGIDLSRLTARDVMVPFTMEWDVAEPWTVAETAIRNSGIVYIPCLEKGSLYLGVLSREMLEGQASDGLNQEGQEEPGELSVMDRIETPLTVREDLPYAELMDHFTADDQHMVVVLRNERPLGYVTHAALASLLESVDRGTFQGDGPIACGTDYLLVPDLASASNHN